MADRRALSRACVSLGKALLLTGCGSQFADPIREQAPAPTCEVRPVARLNGDSYASIPRTIQDDFSIELWLKADASPTGSSFPEGSALVFADVETVQVDDFALGVLNGRAVMSVGSPDTAVTSTSEVTNGAWNHVAATRSIETGVVLIYVNGVLEGAEAGSTHVLDDAASIDLGGRKGRNFFSGELSELRLWSRVRSQAELLASWRSALTGTEPGLTGYYRLDEGTGATARDLSPSQADATFAAAIEWLTEPSPFCSP